MLNLFRRHLFDHLFLADRRIRITADRAQNVPHIGPRHIGSRHAQPDLIVPPNPTLRSGMPLHRCAQIPFKGAHIILLDPKAERVHDADQLFGIRVAGPRGGPKRFHRFSEAPLFHKIARLFDLSRDRSAQRAQNTQYRQYFAHAALLALIPVAAQALDLPEPLTPDQFVPASEQKARIGQLLFYDKILSGNRNISCGTCHHHDHGSTDGLSLGIGEGGVGVGPQRTAGTGVNKIRKRIPRNAPALWNLGHKSRHVLFHDGRISVSDLYGNGYNSPAEEWLPQGLDTLAAAQSLFPMTAQFEMAGNPKENEIAGAVHDRIDAAWPILAKRVRTIPAYGDMFVEAFDDLNTTDEVTIVHIGNALGAFINREWASFDSPFDAFLQSGTPLPAPAMRGMDLFFGDAGCAACHSGPLFTDQGFHAIGLPAFGPGRTRRFDPMPRDVGRMGESDAVEDAYRFRTPSLRNVTLTAPYGHNGAYPTLEAMIRHKVNPTAARAAWAPDSASLPEVPWLAAVDFVIQSDRREMARQAAAQDIDIPALTEADISNLVAFLETLTGVSGNMRPLGRPSEVPSGLPVD